MQKSLFFLLDKYWVYISLTHESDYILNKFLLFLFYQFIKKIYDYRIETKYWMLRLETYPSKINNLFLYIFTVNKRFVIITIIIAVILIIIN